MKTPGVNKFVVPFPTLPVGVATYMGIRCSSWIMRAITLTNEARVEVIKAICHNVDAHLVIDIDRKPLGDDRVAI